MAKAAATDGGPNASLAGPLGDAVRRAFEVVSVERHDVQLRAPRANEPETTAPPVIEIEVPRAEWPCVALVEHTRTGRFSWVFAEAADQPRRAGRPAPIRFRIPVDDALGRRRTLSTGRIVHVLGAKEDDHLFRSSGSQYARWWEQSNRREGLRMFDAASYSIDAPELGLPYPQIRKLADGPSLLFLHGTMAQAHTGFGAMPRAFMEILSDLYSGRLWAYDHFTLSRAPGENAKLLLSDLRRLARQETFEIDVVAHSRGGLVARELAELASRADQVTVRSITFVATPNAGTPLCRQGDLDAFAGQLTNMLLRPQDVPVVGALDSVIALVKHLAVGGLTGIDGIRAMDPDDKRLGALNLGSHPSEVRYFAVGSDVHPAAGSDDELRLRDPRFDAIMDGTPNDLLVPLESVRAAESGTFVADADWLPLTDGQAVDHAGYWRSTRTMNWVRGKLAALASETAAGAVAPASRGGRGVTRGMRNGDASDGPMPAETPVGAAPASGTTTLKAADVRKVRVSICHGSLEHADFPVIVGHYDDAPIRGAEGVVDSRLGGVLSRRYLIDRYPSQIGESIFLRAPEGEVQYPVGVYVVGLGQTGDLNKADLTTAVTRAVVDRCLRLHNTENDRARAAAETGELVVGVSSVLIGSSLEAGGLAVDTSIAALVDGVVRANLALARYEEDSSSGGLNMPSVRIGALQIVERYADRCELASRALSDLDELVGPDRAAELEVITTPEIREGALPPRPPALEVSDSWSRFVVTVSDAEREGRERAAALPDPAAALGREVELDVSYLGRLARTDRSFHRIDRLAVDRLIEQAMQAMEGTGQSANTLYELLFPREFKREVAHATELHLIVDEFTANYPWELLAMRTVGGERRALSLAHGLLRQFRETSPLRWTPRRARHNTALVIGNPPLTTYPSLPGAAEEAQAVTGMLTRYGYKVRSLVWDANGAFVGIGTPPMHPGPAILDALFEDDYRIIHIASHGEVVDDPSRPGEIVQANSGAIIADDLVLSATTIRQLPAMPDLFFLNCCHLARIGINRLSAGVARELMAGGVRAVVAAGWPVSDTAAVRFAAALYESLLSGSDYSYGVERARARARDGSNTWAAYQCYGVPGFRLHPGGRSPEPRRPPLTTDELLRRITWCRVTAGDISRPDAQAVSGIREQLVAELDELAAAAEHEGTWTTPEVCEALGAAYADLASAGQGVRWYRKALEGGRTRSAYRFSAVEQLANLEARAAQQLALNLARQPGGLTAKDRQAIDVQFSEARDRIEKLIGATGRTDERLALKASLAKKHAACLRPSAARDTLVREAAELYEGAEGNASYQRENAAQLRALLREPARKPRAGFTDSDKVTLLIDQQSHLEDYWARTKPGDELLTDLMEMWDKPERDRAATAGKMREAYKDAFGARSSYRQRTQTLDHLQDLAYLLPRDDPRWPHLDEAVKALATLTGTVPTASVVTNGDTEAAPVTTEPVRGPRGRREPTATVTVKALPASYGDSLLVTYGDEKEPTRMLIDAGPASAFKSTIRPMVGDHLDLFVITHVDADHIDGAIQLLVDGKVKADDIWFNGWKHLPTTPTRGGAEGAMLDLLLDGQPWNVAFDGATISVPDEGPLPSVLVAGGARVTLLSPVQEGLVRLRQTWVKALKEKGATPGSPEDAVRLLAEADRFEESRGERRLGRDASVPNGSSIAFLFELGGIACIFTGDAHAGVLARSIARLNAERGVARIRLDLFKVSHHGSRGNISDDVLKQVDCTQFLVSTDGKKFGHPDEDAIRIIADTVPGAQIYVNYSSISEREGIKEHVILQPTIELKG